MNNLQEAQEDMRLRMANKKDVNTENAEVEALIDKSNKGELLCPYCHINKTTVSKRSLIVKPCKKCSVRRPQLYKYGLTLKTYSAMLVEQEKCCAICGLPFEQGSRAPNIDHCHELNHVRGLLCSSCNHILGFCKDNYKILDNAIEYLRQNLTERRWWVTKK